MNGTDVVVLYMYVCPIAMDWIHTMYMNDVFVG